MSEVKGLKIRPEDTRTLLPIGNNNLLAIAIQKYDIFTQLHNCMLIC